MFLKKCLKTIIALSLFCSIAQAKAPDENSLLVLCYHSIKQSVDAKDTYSISQLQFVEQMEYLKTHDFHPVSVEDLILSMNGGKQLPSKPVLLSFDDGYKNFSDFVFPILKRYQFPAMLAVVGSWLDGEPRPDIDEPLMSWSDVREISDSGLVEVASHTYDLHKSIVYNDQGNSASAISVRLFEQNHKSIEKNSEYKARIEKDFEKQGKSFEKRLGHRPRVIVWPYGRFNTIAITTAQSHQYTLGFSLGNSFSTLQKPFGIERILVPPGSMKEFISAVSNGSVKQDPIRSVQIDLDMLIDPTSRAQSQKNIDKLMDRLIDLKINTVFLQAFSDRKGTGNIESVYFKNRILPYHSDLFSYIAHQINIRGIKVFAWMPTLSVVFSDPSFNEQFRVREYKKGVTAVSSSWYHRLTPFSSEVFERMDALYEDLSIVTQIDGILFQDDAYLNDYEDHHPLALKAFEAYLGHPVTSSQLQSNGTLFKEWTAFKTQRLIEFTQKLEKTVLTYRPNAQFARNIYANPVLNPESEEWFAQDYKKFLESYDYTVIMAYPYMEEAKNPSRWLKNLVLKANSYEKSPSRVIFKLQAMNWKKNQWVNDKLMLTYMRDLLSSGAQHIAYYPDNVWENKPNASVIGLEMSLNYLPDESVIPW